MRASAKPIGLAGETQVDVIISKGNNIYKRVMSLSAFQKLPRKAGWKYQCYQLNFSQFKNTKEWKQ